ncbi:MAG: PEP-CTERM sorting domain-containing protein [Verrucomicrobiae bacterium]
MKTTLLKNTLAAIILAISQQCYSQGFVNLDFEAANTSGYSPGAIIPTTVAIPGWSAYFGSSTTPSSGMFYDTVSLGGAMVVLEDNNNPSPKPIQGNYSILLQGSTASTPTSVAIGQTKTIPIGTQSLTFFGVFGGDFRVTFNGQSLAYIVTGSTANYNILAADVSAYAGQAGQLLFTAPVNSYALLDNIQFSTNAVPEPSTFALVGLGGLAFGLFKKRQIRLFLRK